MMANDDWSRLVQTFDNTTVQSRGTMLGSKSKHREKET